MDYYRFIIGITATFTVIMTTIHLLLGTNQGDRIKNLDLAHEMILEKIGMIGRTSQIYSSAPWGFEAEQDFFNQVVCVETELEPKAVLNEILAFEEQHGRIREHKDGIKIYHSRIIDIDILLWEDLVLNTEELIIPHPRMPERRFVLLPLSEVSSDLEHPVLKSTIQELCHICPDLSTVAPIHF
jgi:2-amino-4-hydroxy-6-hydroxymethyldihydropteridine diphosphokinase